MTKLEMNVKRQLKKLISYIGSGTIHNKKGIHDALETVTTLCGDSDSAKDSLRKMGGISVLIDFVCSTTNCNLLECGLKALSCAVDNNTLNQIEATKQDVFSLIQKQETFPPFMLGHVSVKNGNHHVKEVSIELWKAVNSVLCFSMANPVHGMNQKICSQLLPVAVKLLQFSLYSDIIVCVTMFLSCLIEDNAENQSLLIQQGALSVFKHCLEVGVISSIAKNTTCATLSPHENIHATLSLVNLIDRCIMNDASVAASLCEMDVVFLLSKLVFANVLDDSCKTKILLTIGHFIEAYPSSIADLFRDGCVKSFLENHSKSSDENLLKACQYVIHLLLMNERFLRCVEQNVDNPVSGMTPWNFNERYLDEKSASCVTELDIKRARRIQSDVSSTELLPDHKCDERELATMKIDRVRQYLDSLNGTLPLSSSEAFHNCIGPERGSLHWFSKPQLHRSTFFSKNFGSHRSLLKLLKASYSECTDERCRTFHSFLQLRDNNRFEWSGKEGQSDDRAYSTSTGEQNTNCCSCECNKGTRPFLPANHGGPVPKRKTQFCSSETGSNRGQSIAASFSKSVISSAWRKSIGKQKSKSHIKCSVSSNNFSEQMTFSRAHFNPTEGHPKKSSCRFPNESINGSFKKPQSKPPCHLKGKDHAEKNFKFSPFQKSVCLSDISVDVVTASATGEPAAKRLASVNHGSNPTMAEKSNEVDDHSIAVSTLHNAFFNILSFPLMKCDNHGLASSTEKMWLKAVEKKE